MEARPVRVKGLHPYDPHFTPADTLTLPHHERTLRRRALTCDRGLRIVFDLPKSVTLGHRDLIALETGSCVLSVAAPEPCHEIVPSGSAGWPDLAALAWHLGNRHALVQIVSPTHPELATDHDDWQTPDPARRGRILVARDPVLARMVRGLGATVREVVEPFEPIRGAYHAHEHAPEHARARDHAGHPH